MFKLLFSLKKIRISWLHVPWFFLIVVMPKIALAEGSPCNPDSIYEAPPHVALPVEPLVSKVHLKNNEDGTLTDLDSGLMWTQKDSYADLNHCLNFTDSKKYVANLSTGGHTDWRMPTLHEMASIYDETQENIMAWDHDPEYPLALDSQFSDGAAYWYWTSDTGTTELTAHCAKTLYFPKGIIEYRRFELCDNGGVRAVRKTP